jgi:hypothetical protein
MAELAGVLDVDPSEFASLMRATFTERVTGEMGDARSTFSALATRLGCDLTATKLDEVIATRLEHRQRLTYARTLVSSAARTDAW